MPTDVRISADLLLVIDFILFLTLSKLIANKATALEQSKLKKSCKLCKMVEKDSLYSIGNSYCFIHEGEIPS